MHRFLVVIEKAEGNYSAYSPDLPGCVATGKTHEQASRNIHEAIEMHVRGMLEDEAEIQPEFEASLKAALSQAKSGDVLSLDDFRRQLFNE